MPTLLLIPLPLVPHFTLHWPLDSPEPHTHTHTNHALTRCTRTATRLHPRTHLHLLPRTHTHTHHTTHRFLPLLPSGWMTSERERAPCHCMAPPTAFTLCATSSMPPPLPPLSPHTTRKQPEHTLLHCHTHLSLPALLLTTSSAFSHCTLHLHHTSHLPPHLPHTHPPPTRIGYIHGQEGVSLMK